MTDFSANEFLKYFIRKEKYLQNPPLETSKFIDFCSKRGIVINENDLESYEKENLLTPIIRFNRPIINEERIKFIKDGSEGWRPAYFGLEEGEEEIGQYFKKDYGSYSFDLYGHERLLELLDEGHLFSPLSSAFQKWDKFKGEHNVTIQRNI